MSTDSPLNLVNTVCSNLAHVLRDGPNTGISSLHLSRFLRVHAEVLEAISARVGGGVPRCCCSIPARTSSASSKRCAT